MQGTLASQFDRLGLSNWRRNLSRTSVWKKWIDNYGTCPADWTHPWLYFVCLPNLKKTFCGSLFGPNTGPTKWVPHLLQSLWAPGWSMASRRLPTWMLRAKMRGATLQPASLCFPLETSLCESDLNCNVSCQQDFGSTESFASMILYSALQCQIAFPPDLWLNCKSIYCLGV